MSPFSPQTLQKLLSQHPLPGKKAHSKMTDYFRPGYYKQTQDARRAGVLVLFLQNGSEDNILLIRRSQRAGHHSRDRHSGQIGFPGGKMEPGDIDIRATALREAWEEVGIPPEQVKLLGTMSDVYVYVSRFLMTPVVAYTNFNSFQIQEEEVAGIIHLPLDVLLAPNAIRHDGIIRFPSGVTLTEVPHFLYDDHIIWGATGMVLSELREILLAI